MSETTTPSNEARTAVDAAMTSRHSIRAYLNKPVEKALLEDLLQVARFAPSGTNTQPWKAYVLSGEPKAALSKAILDVFHHPEEAAKHKEDYAYYPEKWVSPFIDRRRKVGWDLYSLLGIGKADKEKMHAQHAKNFDFFGAPIGLIFTIDRVMQQGSWLDYGMFLQNVMVAARARGLDTCPQAAFTQYHRIIREQLQLPDNEQVVCGMTLGYADPAAVENSLRTEREPVAGFTSFRGFSS